MSGTLDPLPDYRVTVDGNEQFGTDEQLGALPDFEAIERLS
ncbi:hypothetical protein [Rhizobium sp. CNPSo 3490]|nr:hypothetical protein [Rhizobium sp. CNPSo 3490]MDK4734272.1 hypothetical protein [Rhizobium sp. CNPSo 3490]